MSIVKQVEENVEMMPNGMPQSAYIKVDLKDYHQMMRGAGEFMMVTYAGEDYGFERKVRNKCVGFHHYGEEKAHVAMISYEVERNNSPFSTETEQVQIPLMDYLAEKYDIYRPEQAYPEATRAFHSTDKEEHFKIGKAPFYASTDYDFSGNFGSRTTICEIQTKAPYYIDGIHEGRHFDWDDEDVKYHISQGFDSVIVTHPEGDVVTSIINDGNKILMQNAKRPTTPQADRDRECEPA